MTGVFEINIWQVKINYDEAENEQVVFKKSFVSKITINPTMKFSDIKNMIND